MVSATNIPNIQNQPSIVPLPGGFNTSDQYQRFISLCNQLKQNKTQLNRENSQNLQKIFAYLLDQIKERSETETERKRMFLCFHLLSIYPDLIGPMSIIDDSESSPLESTMKEDVQFILENISQNNRTWVKACLIQHLKNRKRHELAELNVLNERRKIHDKALDASYIGSEVANVGIVLQEVLGGVFLGQRWIDIGIEVSRYSNPVIYAFKVIQRGLKLAGRTFFNLEFSEDEVGINPRQNFWDAVSASIFLTVMVLLIINTPLLNSIAWLIAPVGLGIVWKSEYGYQNERASGRLKNMREAESLFDEDSLKEAARIAWHKKVASYALLGVILGISIGMLAVHASTVPGLDLIFNEHTLQIITALSGSILASLALIRAGNFLWERKGTAIKASLSEFIKDPVQSTKKLINNIGDFLVASIKSIPIALKAVLTYITTLPRKAINYWKGLDNWQKIALGFSLASLALSISVFTGGLPLIAGLVTAGLCSFTSTAIKLGPKIKEAYNKSGVEQPENKRATPFTNNAECERAIENIKQNIRAVDLEQSPKIRPSPLGPRNIADDSLSAQSPPTYCSSRNNKRRYSV